MKKIMIICLLWTSLLSVPVSSQSAKISYKIIYDSSNEGIVEVHEDVLNEASMLFMNANVSSYEVLMKSGIERFKKENRRVSFANHQLLVIVGNGNGSVVEGDFEENEFCLASVKPKSIIKEWLGI